MLWCGVPGVPLGRGVAVGAAVAWPWLPQQGGLCCSPCIVLSSKVKKPVKKQPSELSRKPNQKEKRGRAEEKPRNKSAPAHLPPSPFLLGTGLFLRLQPQHPRVGMGLMGLQHLQRGWASSSPPPELKGLEELLEVTGMRFRGVFCLVGLFLCVFLGTWGTGELSPGWMAPSQCHPPC